MSLQKILFFMADGFDTPTSINQLVETLLCDILDAGVEVHMVAGRKGGSLPDVPDSLLARNGFTYDIVDRGGAVDKSNFAKRFFYDLAYVSKAQKAWWNAISDADCVLVQSTHLGYFHLRAMRKLYRGPIVYNLYDIFPDNVCGTLGDLPYRMFDVLQRRLYPLCDRIVVISDDMKATLVKKGVDARKVAVVPIWHDEAVSPVPWDENRFASSYGVDRGTFIVQFAGSFGYVFDHETVLRTAARLRDREDIEFHMIGQGARLNEFKKAAREKGLANIRFFPWQPASELADVYSACSVGIIPLESGVVFSAYPSKTSSLMACGKPSVYSIEKNSALARQIEELRIGLVADRGDDEALADAIVRLSGSPELLAEMSSNALRYADAELSRSKCTSGFLDLLDEAVGAL